jgi:hypothetical protein
MPRREFLLAALAACAGPLAAGRGTVVTVQDAAGVSSGASRRAMGYLGEGTVEAARRIGRAGLRTLGLRESPAAIATASSPTLDLIDGAATEEAAIDSLVAAVRRDFAEGRSIDVEGWVLSATEVHLCLLTLVAPPA